MLAPDPALATLPISVMVAGMWIGTLPVGMLAKAYGRRFALQTGSVFGVLVRLDFMPGGVVRIVRAVAARHAVRRPLRGGASILSFRRDRHGKRAFRAKAVAWVLAGGVFAAVIGPQLVIFTKELAGLFVRGDVSRAIGLRIARRRRVDTARNSAAAECRILTDGRPLGDRSSRQPQIIVAVGLRRCELRHDEHGDDVGAAGHGDVQSLGRRSGPWHPMARDRHVCAELLHRYADRCASACAR